MLARRLARLGESGLPERCGPLLTRREQQILRLIESGLSNKEIAARLGIEVATVKNHVHHLLEKLGARSRAEAVCIGRRIGICTGVPDWTSSLDSAPPDPTAQTEHVRRTWRDLMTSNEALPG
jgi:DNA-binding CsgD family transcriptional regulator